MLRVIIRRIFDRASEAETLDQSLRLLNTLSAATLNLARLYKINHVITSSGNPLDATLDEIIAELTKELDLKVDC